jgi:hypothetical protein
MLFGCAHIPNLSCQSCELRSVLRRCDDMKQDSLSLLYAFQRVLE